MKNIKSYIVASLAILMFVSCADDSLGPVLTFEKATIGAYVRLIELRTGEFDLANPTTSALDYSVDFVDLEDGGLVSQYVIDAQFFDNTPDNGDNSKARIEYKIFDSGSFTTSSKGNPGVDVQIPLTEVAAAFGLSIDDLSAGDRFSFFGRVRQQDGAEYTSVNSSGTIRGSAFQGYFDFNGNVTCPLPDAMFTGSYALTHVGDASAGFGLPFVEETITLSTVPGSSTLRQMTMNYLPAFGPFAIEGVRIDFICEVVEFQGLDSGVGCGGGSITVVGAHLPDYGTPSPQDITDDSVIILNLVEFDADGGCGVPPAPKTIQLTKV